MESNQEKNNALIWESTVPILTNQIILKQLGMTFWLPIIVLFTAVNFLVNFALEVMMISGGIMLLSLAAMLQVFAYYNWNYRVLMTIDDKGIVFRPALLDSPKWKTIRFIATFLGVFSRRPGVAAAAILSGSGNGETVIWEEVHDFTPVPEQNAYIVKLNGSRKTVVFCNPTNFEAVGERYKTMLDTIRAEYTKEQEAPLDEEVLPTRETK